MLNQAPVQMTQPQDQDQPETVTITESDDGTYTVNGKPVKTIDEALMAAKEILTGDDGGMSVEQAFGQGFKGSEAPGY